MPTYDGVQAQALREAALERDLDANGSEPSQRQAERPQASCANAQLGEWPEEPVFLDRRAREQGLRGQVVVQRRIRLSKRREIPDEERIRQIGVVAGGQGRVPRLGVVPVLLGKNILPDSRGAADVDIIRK